MIIEHPADRSGRRPPPVRPFYWMCQAAGWAVFCGYVTLGYLYSVEGQWQTRDFFNIVLFTMIVSPVVSHGLRSWLWRRGWIRLRLGKLVPRLAVLVVLSAATLTTMTAVGVVLFTGRPWLSPAGFVSMTVGYSWAFAAWLGIYLAVHASRRHNEARAVAREAQLQALKAQLNPHFLFNCLNSIRALIAENPDRAASMVTGLADLLRYSLASDREHTVTLAEELTVVDEYINLERMRFEGRLRIERAVDPLALNARVPPMLVQTLVENAVKHGVADSKTGGLVHLRAAVVGARVDVVVTNTGAFKPAVKSDGYGLRNATERLRLIYGGDASLRVHASGDRTVASLSIPLEIAL